MTDSTNKTIANESRRDFLSKAAVAGTVTIAQVFYYTRLLMLRKL